MLKHHRLLEDAVDDIDKDIAVHDTKETLYEAEQDELASRNDFCVTDEERQLKMEVIGELHAKLLKLENEVYPKRSGEICSKFQNNLDQFHITPEAYHSQCFNGNHCNKYIEAQVYEHITEFVWEQTKNKTNEPCILEKAMNIKAKFNTINNAFRKIHLLISQAKPIDNNSVEAAKKGIEIYMRIFRKCFKEVAITPKQHFLERHCVPWLEKYGFGLGFHGEQGRELFHATVNKLERRVIGMKNEKEQLRVVMQSQHLKTFTELIDCQPPTKKRKKDEQCQALRVDFFFFYL